MPQNIIENFLSDGWDILEVDGHDYNEIYEAFRKRGLRDSNPVCIVARTVMGNGNFLYGGTRRNITGSPLNEAEYEEAMSYSRAGGRA